MNAPSVPLSPQPGPAAGIPDLVTHLEGAYAEARPSPHARSLPDFLDFARAHLDANRPVQTFAADANVGLVLPDATRVLVCRPSRSGSPGGVRVTTFVPMAP